ncbi:TVP38/TMEM64 family protein [Thiohalomonas denitrificans]|uniref:TVP38/TMEM64 family protein n=1 Tax=Thiohalomonas denitrificans TaxID=415747 RepID=UPI0026EA62C7|nr:VTT domain-containing protein [Thiohalomonas denitrificans]
MGHLLKTMLALALFFVSLFSLANAIGLLTTEQVKATLAAIEHSHPAYIAAVVISLLAADLIFAVPTLTVTILAGYLLGWPLAPIVVMLGYSLAGVSGYLISRAHGWRLLNRIYRSQEQLSEMRNAFNRLGPAALLVCRAIPILPEVSCCMAGATGMRFSRFLLLFTTGSLPYALIATYAGSISSFSKPMPAIFTAIGLSVTLWMGGYLLLKRMNRAPAKPS